MTEKHCFPIFLLIIVYFAAFVYNGKKNKEKTMKNKNYLRGIKGIMFIFGLLITGCDGKPAVVAGGNLEQRNLSDFVYILEGHRNGVLANRNGEKIRTQIITFSFAEENRAYFCTTNDKPMYTQLVAFPYVSYCTFPEDFEPVLSLNGQVVFVADRAVKERALESNYYAKRNFKDADNPLLEVFYIEVEEIETYGNEGPNIYTAK
jgi:uncharacterized pyridoxamine 5'-phosphate oxidase family protein